MRILFLTIFFVFVVTNSYGRTFCQWDDVNLKGYNLKSDTGVGYILIEQYPIRSIEILNAKGWFELTRTMPTITDNQIITDEVWEKVGNEVHLTWNVRNKTSDEIDAEITGPMSKAVYELVTGLMSLNIFTIQQAQNFFSQDVIDAYQARKRLEE